MTEGELYLLPINPFTPRQREIIGGILHGKSAKEIAEILGISYYTVKRHIHGYADHHNGGGIYGVVEKLTGERPKNAADLTKILLGDVVLFENNHPKPETQVIYQVPIKLGNS